MVGIYNSGFSSIPCMIPFQVLTYLQVCRGSRIRLDSGGSRFSRKSRVEEEEEEEGSERAAWTYCPPRLARGSIPLKATD